MSAVQVYLGYLIFVTDLRSAVTQLEKNFMCNCHGKDISQHWVSLWQLVQEPINNACEYFAPGDQDLDKIRAAVPSTVL